MLQFPFIDVAFISFVVSASRAPVFDGNAIGPVVASGMKKFPSASVHAEATLLFASMIRTSTDGAGVVAFL